jgi:hypothetical protein
MKDFWILKLSETPTEIQESNSNINIFYFSQDANLFKISCYSNITQLATLEIYNLFGQLVFTTNLPLNTGINNKNFVCDFLKSGLYLISLTTRSGIQTKKAFIE